MDDNMNEFRGMDADNESMEEARRGLDVQTWRLWGTSGISDDISLMADGQLIGLWYALKLIKAGDYEWDVNAARTAVKEEMIKRNLPI